MANQNPPLFFTAANQKRRRSSQNHNSRRRQIWTMEEPEETVFESSSLVIKRNGKKKKRKFSYKVHVSSHDRSLRSRNGSYNSSQLHKSSLRANNRALARAVQQLKEEYRLLYEKYLDSLSEQQRLMMNVSDLKRQAKKDKEEGKWTVNKYQRIREALNEVSNNLMNTVKPLSDALDMCGETSSYQLECKDRDELGCTDLSHSSTLAEDMFSADTKLSAPENVLQPSPLQQAVIEKVPLKRTAFDMSVIMEQSCIENEPESPEEMTQQVKNTGGSSNCVDSIFEEADSASDIDLPLNLIQTPCIARTSSCFKSSGVRKSTSRRVSFEDTSKLCSNQLGLTKEIEKKKAPTIRRETFVLPSGSAQVLTASPRRNKRRSSSKAVNRLCPTDLPPVIETAHETPQAIAPQQDNRRQTFVVRASKQTSQWPSPSSAEKAFGGKNMNILPVSDVIKPCQTKPELAVKCGQEVGNIDSSAHCNLPSQEQFSNITIQTCVSGESLAHFPPVVKGFDFLDNSQLFESEDQTCLMIHTMELTEAFHSEIEVLPCEANTQSLQSGDPSTSNCATVEVKSMGGENEIVQNIGAESYKPFSEVGENHHKGSSTVTEDTTDNNATAEQSKSREEDFHNVSGKTKSKTFSVKKSRVPKLVRPNHSFFNAKKVKTTLMKKSKVKPKEIGKVVQVLAKTALETNSDPYSFCGISPPQLESNQFNLDVPVLQILAYDHVTKLTKNSIMTDDSSQNLKTSSETPNDPLPSHGFCSPPVVNESDDAELPKGYIQSPKKRPPIVFSDSSDDTKTEGEDDTWVPPGKKTKSKSKPKKDSRTTNDAYKRKTVSTDTNHSFDNCTDSPPQDTRRLRKSSAAHLPRKSKASRMENNDKDKGNDVVEATIPQVRTKSGKRKTMRKESEVEIDREAQIGVLEISVSKLNDDGEVAEAVQCLPSPTIKTKHNQRKSMNNPEEMDLSEDIVFDIPNSVTKECNGEASENAVPRSSIVSKAPINGTFASNCVVECSEKKQENLSGINLVENPMLDSVSSLQKEKTKEAASRNGGGKRIKSKSKGTNVCHEGKTHARTGSSERVIPKSPDSIMGKLKTGIKDAEKTGKEVANHRISVAEPEVKKSRHRPLKERCDNNTVPTETVELIKESSVVNQYSSSNVKHSPRLAKKLLSSNSEDSIKIKKQKRPKDNEHTEGGKENNAMKDKPTSRKEKNRECPSKAYSNESLSPTAVTLQKAKQQLAKHVRQSKRSDSLSPSAEKRKWKVLETDSECEHDKECVDVKAVNGIAEVRKPRRATAQVSYKEPSIGRKLRQGDPHTDNMFVAPKKSQNKKSKPGNSGLGVKVQR